MTDPLSITTGAVGIIAFSQSLVESVLKIRAFCKDVRNVSAQHQETLRQLESIGKIMCRLGDRLLRESVSKPDDEMLMTSLQLCQDAASRASALALQLQSGMLKRRKWGAMRAVMRQPDMIKLIERLDRCKADLHLAYTIFIDGQRTKMMEELQQHVKCSRIVRNQITHDHETARLEQTNSNDPICSQPVVTRRHNDQRQQRGRTISICIQPPLWLCRYAVDWSFTRSSGQWTTTLKVYRYLPFDYSIYRVCRSGDTERISRLLEEREVSLTDKFVDCFGKPHSLFSMAAEFEQTRLARFLLDHGSDAEWIPDMRYNVGHVRLNAFAGAVDSNTLSKSETHAQFLLEKSDFCCALARSFLEAGAGEFSASTHEGQLMVLAAIADQSSPDLFISMLENVEIESQLFLVRDAIWDLTFLHLIARAWCRSDWSGPRHRDRLRCLLHNLLIMAVRDGAELYAQREYLTPFMTLIASIDRRSIQCCHSSRHIIRSWVNALTVAGIDLLEYGAKESSMLMSVHECVPMNIFPELDMLAFKYGPLATDWDLWLQHPGDIFAGMFWQAIEDPSRSIPGAWVDLDTQQSYYDEDASLSVRTEYHRVRVNRKTLRRLKRELRVAKCSGRDSPLGRHALAEFKSLVNRRAKLWQTHRARASWSTEDDHLENLMYTAGVAIGLY